MSRIISLELALGRTARIARLPQGRTGGQFVIGFKTIHVLPGQVALDNMLYPIELFDFVCTDQGICMAGRSRPARSADTVYVVFRHVGQIEIHHLGQILYIQSPTTAIIP